MKEKYYNNQVVEIYRTVAIIYLDKQYITNIDPNIKFDSVVKVKGYIDDFMEWLEAESQHEYTKPQVDIDLKIIADCEEFKSNLN